MAFSQPSNVYICNQDGQILNGGGNFTIAIPQGMQNCTSVDVAEFSMYDLLNIWRNGCYFYHSVNGNVRATPMPSGIVTNVNDFINLLNTNLAADGYNIAQYFFRLQNSTTPTPNPYKLEFVYPIGLNVILLGWGTSVPGYGDPYITSIAKWIGVGENDVVGNAGSGIALCPQYYKLLRTTSFGIHCSLNSADSIVANSATNVFPDTSTMAKIISNSTGFGSIIGYQASLEDRISKDAVGTSVYFLNFQILDDDHVPMSDIPVETFIHITLRCTYGK